MLTLLCLTGQASIRAQIISSLTVDDGLSQGYVPSIACDKDGFIWMATLNGLNRYDGHSFMVWNEQEGGLSSNHINTVKYDSRGVLWMSTNKGLEVMDCTTGRITRLKCMEGIVKHQFDAVMIDAKGMLWLTFQKDLFCLSIPSVWASVADISEKARLQKIPLSPDVGELHALLDYKNSILLSTSNGTFTYDPLTKTVQRFTKLSSGYTYGAWYDTVRQQLLVRFKDRLEVLEQEKVRVFPMEQPIWNHDYCIIEDGGEVFVLTKFKVYEWKESKLVFIGEMDVEIVSGAVDRVGHIWLGTNAKGVKIIKPQESVFTTVMQGVSIGGALFDNNDQIWLPSHRNFKESVFTLLDKTTGQLGRQLLAQPRQSAIFGPEGHIWTLSTRDQLEMYTMDGVLVKSSVFQIPPGTFKGEARNLFTVEGTSIVAVTDHSGTLVFFDTRTKAIITVHRLSFLNGISGEIKSMLTDRNGRCWLGTSAGLICLSPYDTKIHVISATGEAGKVLSSEKVNGVFIDSRDPDVLWAGTARGLNRLDINTGNVVAFTKKDGLNDDFIYTILDGKPGDLWLGTNHGLLCFNRYTKQVVHYTVADGLPASEFNTGMAWKGKDSTLYYGTVAGIVYFNPYKMPVQQVNPDIRLTGLEINGTPFRPSGGDSDTAMVPFLNDIVLASQENNLAFRFTVMDFFNAQKYNCRYMLIGADDNWRYAWSNNLITYTNLSPGNYTFVVATRTSNGEWGPGRLIQVHILAPWWNRWWAWLVWVGLTCAIVWSIVRTQRRMSNMRRQIEIEHIKAEYSAALEKNKTQMFVNISHEIRTPITLILGLAEDIEAGAEPDIAGKTTLIRQCGQQLLNVSQQVLDLIKLDENQLELHLQYGDLSAFIRFCAEPFCPVLKKRQMAFTMELPPEPGVMMLFDPKYIQAIISNLLSNAVKFTEDGGAIHLKMWKMEPDKVAFSIRDTGIGIAPKHRSKIFGRYYQVENQNRVSSGTGIGLTYVAELVKLMKGHIAVESEPGTGSTFTVTLPIEYPSDDLLPVAPLLPETDTPADDDTHHRNVPPGIQILVVEDNVEMAKFIKNSLTPEYSVEIAHDGLSGLHKAREIVPELIISDVMMPELNGFDLCAAVKSDLVTNHIPVIMLSARASDADRMKGLQEGADLYITKPFNRELLRLKVANLIALRHNIQMKMQKSFAEGVGKSDRETPEKVFTEKVFAAVEAHYPKPEFGVDDLCRIFNMSNSQFHRKLSAITGITPGQLIKEHRLRRGKELLATKPDLTIAEIAYHVGFRDPNYFSHAFSAAFGISPRQYRNSI